MAAVKVLYPPGLVRISSRIIRCGCDWLLSLRWRLKGCGPALALSFLILCFFINSSRVTLCFSLRWLNTFVMLPRGTEVVNLAHYVLLLFIGFFEPEELFLPYLSTNRLCPPSVISQSSSRCFWTPDTTHLLCSLAVWESVGRRGRESIAHAHLFQKLCKERCQINHLNSIIYLLRLFDTKT